MKPDVPHDLLATNPALLPELPHAATQALKRRAFWSPKRASGRLLVGVAVGVVAASLVPHGTHWQLRGVLGWDAFALTMVSLVWSIILKATPEQTRLRAGSDDPGRNMVLATALGSSLFSLFAALVVIRQAKTASDYPLLWGGLGTLAVVLSWVLTHTSYALRYARLYYRPRSAGGGLEFPGGKPPCDLDFAYFAFVIGMCFQVSDVTISRSSIRRAVLGHSLLSFVYNTVIVAMVLNLVLGFMS